MITLTTGPHGEGGSWAYRLTCKLCDHAEIIEGSYTDAQERRTSHRASPGHRAKLAGQRRTVGRHSAQGAALGPVARGRSTPKPKVENDEDEWETFE